MSEYTTEKTNLNYLQQKTGCTFKLLILASFILQLQYGRSNENIQVH